jgi:hypothetical protein
MPEIPSNPIPSLRAFLGQIALTKTTARTTNRSLYKLQGGLVQNDLDVREVVNGAVDAIDAFDVGTQTSTDQRGHAGFVEVLTQDGTGGTETIQTYSYSGTAVCDSYEVDVSMLTDDGQDGLIGKYVFGVVWDGAALSAVGSSTSIFENSTAGAAGAAFELAVVGSTVELQFTGVADWRWCVAVRRTRMRF